MAHLKRNCFLLPAILLCLFSLCASAETTMTVMSIGKADCILLQTERFCWMVDTGTEEAWEKVQAFLEHSGIRQLNGVILTHADKDHIGGTEGLISSPIRVDSWYTSAFCAKYNRDTNPSVEAITDNGQDIVYLRAGDVLQLSESDTIRVLWPSRYSEDENENSLVMVLETPDGRILLMGDALTDNEKELVSLGEIPTCNILKVGHHGREDATGKKLLNACKPDVAVITTETGEKTSKADREVLKRLLKRDIQVVLTHYAPVAVRLTLRAGAVSVELMEE